MLGYIKMGSVVGQDFSFFEFNKPEQIFDIEVVSANRCRCTAKGYGDLNGPLDGSWYGNGKIYTSKENIVFLENSRESDRAY
jgi:hypothetical protein